MYKALGYLVAFGAGAGTLQLYQMRNMESYSNDSTPGHKMTMKGRMLDMGAKMMQNFAPINSIHQHVCGFHFYSGQLNRQITAHHYCSHLNQDMRQCVIYDSDEPNAKLIGIEYIISAKLYATLPNEEKKLWHSHIHEVKSGELIAIGVPDVAEKEVMKDVINTYGKTFHTWQVDRDDLPLGLPQLMMGLTADGQVDEYLFKKRNEKYKISIENKRQQRADIKPLDKDPMADNWMTSGKCIQLEAKETKMQK